MFSWLNKIFNLSKAKKLHTSPPAWRRGTRAPSRFAGMPLTQSRRLGSLVRESSPLSLQHLWLILNWRDPGQFLLSSFKILRDQWSRESAWTSVKEDWTTWKYCTCCKNRRTIERKKLFQTRVGLECQ